MNIIDEFFLLFKSNAKDVQKDVQAAQKATDDFQQELGRTDETAGKLGVTFGKLALAGVAALEGFASLGKLKDGIVNAINYNAQLEKTSKLTNVNARELSVWNDVVARAGGNPTSQEYLSFITKLNQQYADRGINQRIQYVNRDLGDLADTIKRLNDATPGSGYAAAKKLGVGDDLYLALKNGKAALQDDIQLMSMLDNVTGQGAESALDLKKQWVDIGIIFRSSFNDFAPVAKLFTTFVEAFAFGIKGLGAVFQSITHLSLEPLKKAFAAEGAATARLAGAPSVAAAPPLPASGNAPLGIRDNNPGNLRPGGVEAVYPTQQAGLDAEQAQLQRYGARGINTVSSIISTYAPPNENNTPAYIAAVSRATGYAPNQQLDLDNPEVRARLANAINAHEDGPSYGGLIPTAQNAITTAQATQLPPSSNGSKSIAIGAITINSQATDADGVARDLHGALNKHLTDTVGSFDDAVLY